MRNFAAIIAFLLAPIVVKGAPPNFTGHWKQQTQSKAQRQLEIEQYGQNLRVKTIAVGSDGTRTLEVKYVIGETATAYKGLDGDDFESKVHWENDTLIFETIEHERGREIPQKASWALSGDGTTLEATRISAKSGEATRLTYTRQR